MTVTRINTGLYQLTHKGRVFQIEDINQASDGEIPRAWMVYEMLGSEHGRREFCNDYTTKRYAIADTIAAIDEGY